MEAIKNMSETKDFIDLTPTWEATMLLCVQAYKDTGDRKHLAEPLRAMRMLDKIIRDKKEAEA